MGNSGAVVESNGITIDTHSSGTSSIEIGNITSNGHPVDIHGDISSGCIRISNTCVWKACSCDGFSSTGLCSDCTCSMTNGDVEVACVEAGTAAARTQKFLAANATRP